LRQAADPIKTAGLTPYDATCRAPTLFAGGAMTAPRTIDHAVALLSRAIASHARGDRLTVMTARSELVALAGAMDGFEV